MRAGRLGLRVEGAAIALVCCTATNTLLLSAYQLYRDYVLLRGSPQATWHGWSWGALRGWRPYLALGMPAAAMICCEWWLWEFLIILAGDAGWALEAGTGRHWLRMHPRALLHKRSPRNLAPPASPHPCAHALLALTLPHVHACTLAAGLLPTGSTAVGVMGLCIQVGRAGPACVGHRLCFAYQSVCSPHRCSATMPLSPLAGLQITNPSYMVPSSFGSATAVRVANLLGAGRAMAARTAAR